MSLSKDAIDTLIARGRMDSFAKVYGHENDVHPAAILHDPELSMVDLDKYRDYKRHYSAGYDTHLIASFMAYVLNNVQDGASTQVFINSQQMFAQSVLDALIPVIDSSAETSDGEAPTYTEEPGLCKHRAMLQLRKHPDFEVLNEQVSDGWMSQRDAIEFIQSIPHTLQEPDKLIRIFQKLKVKANKEGSSNVTQLSQERSALEQVELQSDIEVPEIVDFSLLCYEELGAQVVPTRITVKVVDDNEFRIRFSYVNFGLIEQKLAAELIDKIEAKTEGKVSLFEGTIRY